MASTSGIGNPGSGSLPLEQTPKHGAVDPQDELAFQEALNTTTSDQASDRTRVAIDPKFRMVGWRDFSETIQGNTPSDDLDNYQPDTPEVPSPEEKPSNFWESLWSGINRGVETVKDFLSKPEVAQFVRAANVVFAGAMVVAAGVMFATGVGAPAGVAALALAGGAGLVMQLPAVHDKLQAGVVAVMTPIIGQENAENLGPLVTQGLISGLMIAIVATGGQAGSAQGALDAAIGVFNSMKDVCNGISQVYQAGGPVLEMFGVNVDAKALQNMAGIFGMMGALMPDLSKFAEGLGVSLKDFLANPNMDGIQTFLASLQSAPESITRLLDADFLKGLGAVIDSTDKLLEALKNDTVLQTLISLLSQSSSALTAKT
jgi:hypothetical protein